MPQAEGERRENYHNDHDLLIEFRAEVGVKLDRALSDIKELSKLADGRLLKSDFDEWKKEEYEPKQSTQDQQIDLLKRYLFIGIGAAIILGPVLTAVVLRFFHLS